ncbi:LOW QUALITY PROTEIN: vacuolar protein sorting-associated protein 37B-like [Menidia menidia]
MAALPDRFVSYTMTQLNEILEDDDKLSEMVQQMEEMQEVQQSKQQTLLQNRTLAQQNLALQPRLEQQKQELRAQYGRLQEGLEALQLRSSALDQRGGRASLDTLLALLQAEGAKVEEETENMADSFLEGDVTLEVFVDSYRSSRTLAHLRRVKIERLQELVLGGGGAPPTGPEGGGAPPGPPPPPSPVATPRRRPPAPPAQPPPALSPAPPYPQIPPRTGLPPPSGYPPAPPTGYPPTPYLAQYPPVPQRAPPRLAPQPGFIMQ